LNWETYEIAKEISPAPILATCQSLIGRTVRDRQCCWTKSRWKLVLASWSCNYYWLHFPNLMPLLYIYFFGMNSALRLPC